jgi:hypothetical protein
VNSSSRNGAWVIWLAVHTTEGIMRATDLRAWTSWPGSSHASSDETGALLTPADGFVPYDRAAWTLRNGNAISENIEQCGWARWTRAEWLARPKLLDATARWLADRSKARGIPLVRLTPMQIRTRQPGVLGHGDYTAATGDGTHTDPGPGYPWDVVLAQANAYAKGQQPQQEDDDMPALSFIHDGSGPWWLYDGFRRRYVRPGEPTRLVALGLVKAAPHPTLLSKADMAAIPIDLPDPVDEKALAAYLAEAQRTPPPT